MSEILLLSKFEKEKKVIELHFEKGKTIREIAKEVHMSFRDISKLIKVYEKKVRLESKKEAKGANNQSSHKTKKLSKNSQAYELFHNGVSPVKVAVELNLDFQKVRKYWLEYLRLNKMTKLYNIYIENEYHLDSLFKIYYYMLRNEIDFKNMENILLVADETTKLYQIHSNLKAEIEKLKQIKNNYLLNKQNTNNYKQLPPLGPLPRYYNW